MGGGGVGASRKFFEMPGTNGNLGKVGAYNVDTMEEVWSHQQRASLHTGTISTGGNLVFVGDLDRRFNFNISSDEFSSARDVVVSCNPGVGRSVPGARGAQHTTNMAAALSKLPLRTISTISSFL